MPITVVASSRGYTSQSVSNWAAARGYRGKRDLIHNVRGTCRLIGVAASTGGPGAQMQLFCGLGPDFPLPIVVVQHMTPAFLRGFADWLASVTPFPVSIVPDTSPADGVHRPSASVLFSSMARTLGSGAVGIVLTQMGDDGATGVAELRRAGSWVIAEDESTAAVYGMPAAAIHRRRETRLSGESVHRVLRGRRGQDATADRRSAGLRPRLASGQ